MMLSIILVAFCLRIIITGVGPLLPEITESLGLSGSASGLLTTLPLIAFAVVSPLTGGIGRRLGEGRTVLIGLCLILLGTVLRSTAGILGLFLGTAIVGVGTAIGNVLLPAVVKAEYPTRVGRSRPTSPWPWWRLPPSVWRSMFRFPPPAWDGTVR